MMVSLGQFSLGQFSLGQFSLVSSTNDRFALSETGSRHPPAAVKLDAAGNASPLPPPGAKRRALADGQLAVLVAHFA
jgi:hypothetical protein